MRMTSSKCNHTDDEERNYVAEKPMTEEIKMILKFKTVQEISSVSLIMLKNGFGKILETLQ